MAYYSGDEDKEVGAAGSDEAVNKSGSGSVISGAGATGGPTQNAPAEKAAATGMGAKASPFVGINEYLNANKPQSANLGKKIGGYVEGKIDNAGQKLNEAETGFEGDVDKNTAKLDQNLVDQVKANPLAVTQDQAKTQQVKNMSRAYGGPTDFQTSSQFQGAQPDIKKAQTAVGQLGGAAPEQTALLTNFQTDTRGGKVNRGAATLDQGLLQASDESKAAIAPTLQKGQEFNNQGINSVISKAMDKVSQGKKTSADTNAYMQDLYNQQFAQQQSDLSQRANDVNSQALQRRNDLISNAINSPDKLSDKDLSDLGVDRNTFNQMRNDAIKYSTPEGTSLTGGNAGALKSYFKTSDANANVQNVASADDYARAQALQQLAGFGGDYLRDPRQAGTYNQNLVSFDQAGAQKYLAPLAQQAAQKQAAAQAQAAADEARRKAEQDERDRINALSSTGGYKARS